MLPAALEAAIARLTAEGGSLSAATRQMSGHYRGGGASVGLVDLRAYLVSRLPATFAAVSRVMAELRDRHPDFVPLSLLDAGAGPGTASWAAAEQFASLTRIVLADSHGPFLDLAKRLAGESPHPALRTAETLTVRIETEGVLPRADLVTAAYALAEIPATDVAAAVFSLWSATGGTLVLVEPGTPAGFGRILQARSTLLAAGAHLLAPCPHEGTCPVVAPDWCHFAVRLERRRAHLHAKQAKVPFEDEKFAYLVASRTARPLPSARIVAPPRDGKPGIDLTLCTPAGIVRETVARRDRSLYKRARKCRWGDSWQAGRNGVAPAGIVND